MLKITAESGAQVDIEEDGTIHIASPDAAACEAAKKMIETIVFVPGTTLADDLPNLLRVNLHANHFRGVPAHLGPGLGDAGEHKTAPPPRGPSAAPPWP